MKQKNIFIATAVALIVAFVAGAFFIKNQRAEEAARMAAKNSEALVRFHSPTVGEANAPVHIVEFLDPACETCAEFYPFVKKMMAANPGKIRLTVRYAPFHRGSDQVVKMLEAARKQGKYWQAVEALLSSQQQWVLNHAAQPDAAARVLGSVGLDMERIVFDMTAPEIARAIEQDIADTQVLNVTKTPEFFVNGRPMPSFGYDQLQKLVNDALAEADKSK